MRTRIPPYVAVAAAVFCAAPYVAEAQASRSAERTIRQSDSAAVAPTIANEDIKVADRCARRGVYCLTRLQLDANPSARLSDLLAHASGVIRRCDGSTSSCALYMRPAAGPGECTPNYYVDGSPFTPLLDNPITVLETGISPAEVRKIEVYRAEQRPHDYGGWRDCGAIVIWRR